MKGVDFLANGSVIEIKAKVVDETSSGVASVEKSLSKMETAWKKLESTWGSLQESSKVEMQATLQDDVSLSLENISSLWGSLSGKVWDVTLQAVDEVSVPFQEILSGITSSGNGVSFSSLLSNSGKNVSDSSDSSTSATIPNVESNDSIFGVLSSGFDKICSGFSSFLGIGTPSESNPSGDSFTFANSSSGADYSQSMMENLQNTENLSQAFSTLLNSTSETKQEMEGLSGSFLQSQEMFQSMLSSFQGLEQVSPEFSVENFVNGLEEISMKGSQVGVELKDHLDLSSFVGEVGISASWEVEDWEEMDLSQKIVLMWEYITSDPVSEWWDSIGSSSMESVKQSANSAICDLFSESVPDGFTLGLSSDAVMEEGVSMGMSFSEGLLSGMDLGAVESSLFSNLSLESPELIAVSQNTYGESASSFSESLCQVSVYQEELQRQAEEMISVTQGFGESFTVVNEYLQEVGEATSTLLEEGVTSFFGEVLPETVGGIWGNLSELMVQEVEGSGEILDLSLNEFFQVTLPECFAQLWTEAENRLSEGSLSSLELIYEDLGIFFGETVPTSLQIIWESSTSFLDENIAYCNEIIGNDISVFVGEVIPSSIAYIWENAGNVLEVSKNSSLSTINQGISSFFTTVSYSVNSLFSQAQSTVNSALAAASAALSSMSLSVSSGTGTSVSAYANGGILSSPHMGLVAEDGPEAIIPLSGKRRDRGIQLWQEAGERLGVLPYAEGGIVGSVMEGTGNSGGLVIPVSVNGVNFSVNVEGNGNSVVEEVKAHVGELTDQIAGQLASSLKQVFQNMSLVVEYM